MRPDLFKHFVVGLSIALLGRFSNVSRVGSLSVTTGVAVAWEVRQGTTHSGRVEAVDVGATMLGAGLGLLLTPNHRRSTFATNPIAAPATTSVEVHAAAGIVRDLRTVCDSVACGAWLRVPRDSLDPSLRR